MNAAPRALVVLSVLTALALALLADDLPFEKKMKELAAANSGVVEVSRIGSSRQGRPLHLLKLSDRGEGNAERPALVIVAGINGMHHVGVDVAVGLAEKLATEHADLLKTTTVYIVPCLNPDTMAWHLAGGHPKADWNRTIAPQDADHDGRIDEDPGEDLNGDGVISLMRVKDPKPGSGLRAEYCVDPENPKLLKKPDAAKGERAVYALVIEGTDNDGDGKLNEDGVGGSGGGGIDLDMNFPYRWPEYADGAGAFQLCEPESRALADWMLTLKSVAAVLVYGPGDTLVNVPQVGKFDQTQSVPLGIEEGDKTGYEEVSKLFKEATNQTGAPTTEMAGSFQGWAYAHYGVMSFETPVWVRPDLVKKEEPKKEGEKPAGEGEKKPEDGAAANPAEMTPEQIRARMEQFQNATPEERTRMLAEFQNLPADVRERMMSRLGGGGGRGGAGGGGAQQPAAPPPAGGGGQPGATGQPAGGGPPGGGGGRGGGGRGGRGGGGGAGGGGGPPGAGGAGGGGRAAEGRKPGEPSGDDAKWLKYDDELVKAGATSGFLDWKPCTHPKLGEVEVGGFVPGFKVNPPDAELPRLVGEQAKFVTGLVGRFPKVRVEDPVVEMVGDGMWRISVRAVNDGAMPTMTAMGSKARRETPTIITIDVPLDRIVAGEKINRTQVMAGNGGRAETQWLVTGAQGSTVNVQVRPTVGPKVTVPVKLEEAAR